MYSLIFRYEDKSFYAYKDKWRVRTKGVVESENEIYSKEDTEKIINTILINKILESKQKNEFRKQNSLNIKVGFIFYGHVTLYKTWKGEYTPYIYVTNWYETLFMIHLKNPRCFEFESIRALLTGRYKVYSEDGIITFPSFGKQTSESGKIIENINNCYKDVIRSVESDRKAFISKKKEC